MMLNSFLVVFVSFINLCHVQSTNIICKMSSAIYSIPGNVTITGYIGVHYGDECSKVDLVSLQVAAAAASAVATIRDKNLLPGLRLGLSLYDTCGKAEMAQKTIVSSLVETRCKQQYLIGGLSTDRQTDLVESTSSSLGLHLTTGYAGSLDMTTATSLAADLLVELRWLTVDHLVVYQAGILATREFFRSASTKGICVLAQTSMDKMNQIAPYSVIVVITGGRDVSTVLEGIQNQRILVVSSDGAYQPVLMKNSDTFVLLPTTLKNLDLDNPYNISEEKTPDYNSLTESKSTLTAIQMLSDLTNLVNRFKYESRRLCPETESHVCDKLPQSGFNATTYVVTQDVSYVLRSLKLYGVKPEEFVSFVVLKQSETLNKVGHVKLINKKYHLHLDYNLTTPTRNCRDPNATLDCSRCENYKLIVGDYEDGEEPVSYTFMTSIEFRDEAWIAALLSVSVVGILCCFAIAIFIMVRMCKRDILEGNPACSFVMLFSIILMYASILPYSVRSDPTYEGVMCGLKLFGTSMSFSVVYSSMLARSVMLASCDKDGGFMSHINGYVQAVLCFFIAAVQIGLGLQFWAINWVLLEKEECLAMSKGNLFLILLSYDVFLLVILVCVTPFIAKSKRNYYEGRYFTAAVWLSAIIWVVWCTVYACFDLKDQAVSGGLVATATCLLVTVFIPRTYLMVTGIVRDHIVSTLPSLAHTAATSVVDVNYRSTQALYDSVAARVDANYYVDRPTTPSTTRMDGRAKSPENTYERYDSPPSPQNITRF